MVIKEQVAMLVGKIQNLQAVLADEVGELKTAFEGLKEIIKDLQNRLGDVENIDISATLNQVDDIIAGIEALSDLAVDTDTEAPGQPGMPSADEIGATFVSFSWAAASDNIGVAKYDLFANGQKIGESLTNAFTATGLAPENQYLFAVQAFDAAGNGSMLSDALDVITLAE